VPTGGISDVGADKGAAAARKSNINPAEMNQNLAESNYNWRW